MSAPVLHYSPPQASARRSRWALFAFVWSVVAPAAVFTALVNLADAIDDVFGRPPLVWIFAAAMTAAPLLAVFVGGMCLGSLQRLEGRRRDRAFALAAVVLGWAQVVGFAVILAAVWRA